MHKVKKLCTQAIVCSLLISHVMGVDVMSPAQPQTPQARYLQPLSPNSSPLSKLKPRLFHSWLQAHREWFFDGRRVIFCDLEADPKIGGPITEATFIETQKGEATGKVLHYYFNPETKVTHPHVKKIDPINPKLQPTFSQAAPDIYDFIKGATLVTYGPFDARKLKEHFSYQPPYGTLYEITYVDALTMVKHDYARSQGVKVTSTPHKKVTTISKTRREVRKEEAKRRKANRDAKENKEIRKEEKRQLAKSQGLGSPKPKTRKSIFTGQKFSQKEIAKKHGIDDKFGAASIGIDAAQAYTSSAIPHAHQGEDHHAFTDTLKLAGIGTLLAQPDAEILAARKDVASITRVLDFGTPDDDEADVRSSTHTSNDDDSDYGSAPAPTPPLESPKAINFSNKFKENTPPAKRPRKSHPLHKKSNAAEDSELGSEESSGRVKRIKSRLTKPASRDITLSPKKSAQPQTLRKRYRVNEKDDLSSLVSEEGSIHTSSPRVKKVSKRSATKKAIMSQQTKPKDKM
ncbi:MAG: hypothetical protein FJX03_06475 [Alphaproteobacteria bacterium]|nr:hypothetical protein [Alphaproteobacteria bacterium]